MKEKTLRFLEAHQSKELLNFVDEARYRQKNGAWKDFPFCLKNLHLENITKEQYEFALNKIEELLPLVTDETPANAPEAIELALMSDIVEAYEKKHYPIG